MSIPSNSPITPFATTYSNGGNSAFVPNLIVSFFPLSPELLELLHAVKVTAKRAAAVIVLSTFLIFFIIAFLLNCFLSKAVSCPTDFLI